MTIQSNKVGVVSGNAHSITSVLSNQLINRLINQSLYALIINLKIPSTNTKIARDTVIYEPMDAYGNTLTIVRIK